MEPCFLKFSYPFVCSGPALGRVANPKVECGREGKARSLAVCSTIQFALRVLVRRLAPMRFALLLPAMLWASLSTMGARRGLPLLSHSISASLLSLFGSFFFPFLTVVLLFFCFFATVLQRLLCWRGVAWAALPQWCAPCGS